MASSQNRLPEDALLATYLLGRLPEDERERLDELSVSNEEFAWRLNAVENDLVDAYVRDGLSPADEKQFKTVYLLSSRGKEKVQFARGLLELERRATAPAKVESASLASALQKQRSVPRLFPRFVFQWGLAAASLALLVIGGLLLVQNAQLRRELKQAEVDHAALAQHTQDLQKQLDQQKAALDETSKPQQNARPNLDQLQTVSVLL